MTESFVYPNSMNEVLVGFMFGAYKHFSVLLFCHSMQPSYHLTRRCNEVNTVIITVTYERDLVRNSIPIRVEACVRNVIAKHECMVWLSRTAILKVKSSCLRRHHCFLSTQTILACFAFAVWVHSGPILLLVSLPANFNVFSCFLSPDQIKMTT